MKQKLLLLGVWNQLPAGVWTWFNDAGVSHFEKLSGRRVGLFCYIKNELNYECFVCKDTDTLKQDLDALSHSDQQTYVQNIVDDYYLHAAPLENEIRITEDANPTSLSNEELASRIEKLAEAWPLVVMQIWYAVLLDIWYPAAEERVEIKSIIAKARDHCGHLHERSSTAEQRMYRETAKRVSVSEQNIYFMTQPEIASVLRGGTTPETLPARLISCVLSNHSGAVVVYAGSEAEQLKEIFEVPVIGQAKETILKGTPACKGNIKGRARVILLDKEFSSFEEGEILVSLTTMFHYVPLMKKAQAILTEFGGLTSHAAVVSRELGKPAIVGIHNLIASIQTGDLLDVDAEKGTVTILGR